MWWASPTTTDPSVSVTMTQVLIALGGFLVVVLGIASELGRRMLRQVKDVGTSVNPSGGPPIAQTMGQVNGRTQLIEARLRLLEDAMANLLVKSDESARKTDDLTGMVTSLTQMVGAQGQRVTVIEQREGRS